MIKFQNLYFIRKYITFNPARIISLKHKKYSKKLNSFRCELFNRSWITQSLSDLFRLLFSVVMVVKNRNVRISVISLVFDPGPGPGMWSYPDPTRNFLLQPVPEPIRGTLPGPWLRFRSGSGYPTGLQGSNSENFCGKITFPRDVLLRTPVAVVATIFAQKKKGRVFGMKKIKKTHGVRNKTVPDHVGLELIQLFRYFSAVLFRNEKYKYLGEEYCDLNL